MNKKVENIENDATKILGTIEQNKRYKAGKAVKKEWYEKVYHTNNYGLKIVRVQELNNGMISRRLACQATKDENGKFVVKRISISDCQDYLRKEGLI